MTEDEYSITSDLAKVRSVKAILRDICPEIGSDVISKAEWQEVMQKLTGWENRLNKLLEITDD